MLGRALLRNGEHEAALRAFLRELEINPDDFDTNLQVGELKKREQQFDDARDLHRARAADAARRRRPPASRWPASTSRRARTRRRRELLEGVVAAEPKYSEACALLATVYYRLQRKADGDRMRARVEELNAEAQARQPGAQPPPQPGAPAAAAVRPPALLALVAPDVEPTTPSALPSANQPSDDVRLAVAVHVAEVERRVRRRAGFERVPLEAARRRLLQPHQRRPGVGVASPPTIIADGDDVEVAVAVEVGGLGALRARQRRQAVLDERERAGVLEPDDAVVRLQDEVVEGVAVREQDVEVAVLVEVDELDAGRAPVRVRRLVDRLRREREALAAC